MLYGIKSYVADKACSLGAESYCPPKPVIDACEGLFDCYVKPYMPSYSTIAGVVAGVAAIAGGAYAYSKKDAIGDKNADEIKPVLGSITNEQGERRSARLNSK